jgi:hypothetical protein
MDQQMFPRDNAKKGTVIRYIACHSRENKPVDISQVLSPSVADAFLVTIESHADHTWHLEYNPAAAKAKESLTRVAPAALAYAMASGQKGTVWALAPFIKHFIGLEAPEGQRTHNYPLMTLQMKPASETHQKPWSFLIVYVRNEKKAAEEKKSKTTTTAAANGKKKKTTTTKKAKEAEEEEEEKPKKKKKQPATQKKKPAVVAEEEKKVVVVEEKKKPAPIQIPPPEAPKPMEVDDGSDSDEPDILSPVVKPTPVATQPASQELSSDWDENPMGIKPVPVTTTTPVEPPQPPVVVVVAAPPSPPREPVAATDPKSLEAILLKSGYAPKTSAAADKLLQGGEEMECTKVKVTEDGDDTGASMRAMLRTLGLDVTKGRNVKEITFMDKKYVTVSSHNDPTNLAIVVVPQVLASRMVSPNEAPSLPVVPAPGAKGPKGSIYSIIHFKSQVAVDQKVQTIKKNLQGPKSPYSNLVLHLPRSTSN